MAASGMKNQKITGKSKHVVVVLVCVITTDLTKGKHPEVAAGRTGASEVA